MAIDDTKGTVTTTGMMGKKPSVPKAPDMSKIKMPTARKDRPNSQPAPQIKQEEPKQSPSLSLMEKVQSLTDQDKAVLTTVLSPSVSNVLKKIAPELTPLLDEVGADEENVTLPVSIVKDFASRKYPGTEQESVQSFVSDLAGQMEQPTVPPDTEMSSDPGLNIENEINAIDTDQMTV